MTEKLIIWEIGLDELINKAVPNLREITFHTDGKAVAKTGGKAKHPKKLYCGKLSQHKSWADATKTAINKLLKEN